MAQVRVVSADGGRIQLVAGDLRLACDALPSKIIELIFVQASTP